MVSVPPGTEPLAVTLRILSLSTITTAFAITRWPSHNLPNLIALVAAAASSVAAARRQATSTPNLIIAPAAYHAKAQGYQPRRARTSPAARCARTTSNVERFQAGGCVENTAAGMFIQKMQDLSTDGATPPVGRRTEENDPYAP